MMNISDKHSLLFLKSAFTNEGKFISTNKIIEWLAAQNEKIAVNINKIPFDKLKSWSITDNNLMHDSGNFFSIDGIHVKTNWNGESEWEQPIINQPEIGYLGFITKEFDGVLYFLVQAKIEPGNVNHVQLSPTLQATRSNYNQVHKGEKPLYLDYFINVQPGQILLDQLQSEQGARFLKKRNRNIIIKIEDDIRLYDNFVWMTLAQLKTLLQHDNLVNMDARTVISGISFGSYDSSVIDFINYSGRNAGTNPIKEAALRSALISEGALHSIEEILNYLTRIKSKYYLDINKIPIATIKDWVIGEHEIYHKDHKYFKVIAVEVAIANREVVKWTQPMIEPAQEGLCAFVCKEINGILHFAVQTKMECGNLDIIEFAPTVQCLTDNYRNTKKGSLPFLDYVLKAKKEQTLFDAYQSEEGGRFYKEQNRNLIVLAGNEVPEELPENYIWMTLHQMNTFLKFNNYLNIQARSLISTISFI
jgi:oxidase EvaA